MYVSLIDNNKIYDKIQAMKTYLPPSRSDLRQDGDVTVISIINNKTCTKYKNIRSIYTRL